MAVGSLFMSAKPGLIKEQIGTKSQEMWATLLVNGYKANSILSVNTLAKVSKQLPNLLEVLSIRSLEE